jgi:hypothetical protein
MAMRRPGFLFFLGGEMKMPPTPKGGRQGARNKENAKQFI